MKKFKSGDLVENIHTREIEMIRSNQKESYYMAEIILRNHNLDLFFLVYPKSYRLINPKKVKFNL